MPNRLGSKCLACSHYSLADLLRLFRGARRGDDLSSPSPDAEADLRARRGFASPPPRFLALLALGSGSWSASSPVRGRSGTDSMKIGSGAGREVSTTPTDRRFAGGVPTLAPIGPRPRPRLGALRAPIPVGIDGAEGAVTFGGSAAASCSLTGVSVAAGATS